MSLCAGCGAQHLGFERVGCNAIRLNGCDILAFEKCSTNSSNAV